MPRYAIVENGIVINVAVASEPVNPSWVEVSGQESKGWTYDGSTFTPPPEPAPQAPDEVTKLQIFDQVAAMEDNDPITYSGLWSSIETFIAADSRRQSRWNLAIGIPTDDPILDDLQVQLGWTDEQRNSFLIFAGNR